MIALLFGGAVYSLLYGFVLAFIHRKKFANDFKKRFMMNISKEKFFENREKQSAVIREIEIIGEAVKNLPLSFRKKYNNVPWIKITGMRDKLMHHYFGVNLETVWKTVHEDIPYLKKEIYVIKKDFS